MNTLSKIQVESLNVFFGAKQVIHTVSFDIPDRQVIALIGPSGCGKSTLLRAINRMHDLTHSAKIEGSIFVDGTDIYGSQSDPVMIRRKVGMVFQRPNPFPKSIFENIAYGLRLGGLNNKTELHDRVEKALKDAHLFEEIPNLNMSAMDLSGGQQQRLCIARTIAVSPEVILMDEPCSALDPISTHKVEDLILRLKENYCVVIVTHNMQQAKRVSDKTAFMYLGKLIEYNATKAVFESPEDPLSQKYLAGSFG